MTSGDMLRMQPLTKKSSLEAIRRQLDEEGFCVISDVLSAEELDSARRALDRAAAEDDAAGLQRRASAERVTNRLG